MILLWPTTVANQPSELLNENSFCIFCVTRMSVNYSKRSTKHNDLSQYLRQLYRKMELQFDVVKFKKRKYLAYDMLQDQQQRISNSLAET